MDDKTDNIIEQNNTSQKVLTPYDSTYALMPFGLRNTGVICYLNSFVQALMSCTSINKYFLNNEQRFIEEKNDVAICYTNLIKQAITHKKTQDRGSFVLDPVSLFNIIILKTREKYPNKKFGMGQEDSGEGLHLFLDAIDDKTLYKLFMHQYIAKIWCLGCKNMISESIDDAVMLEVYQKYNPIKSDNITNQHPLNNHVFQYLSPLPDYKCLCGKQKCCTTYQISSAPEIITIMFHKFHQKINLDFPEFMYFPSNKGYLKYKIVAKIEHSGGTSGGHYWTHGLRTIGMRQSMVILNDTSCEQKGNVLPTANTYIIFYHYIEEIKKQTETGDTEYLIESGNYDSESI